MATTTVPHHRLRQRWPWLPVTATLLLAAILCLISAPAVARGQEPPAPPRRIHLILKDGSFQIVTSYKIVGNNVRYRSAERAGAEEEVPVALVDLDATHRWEQRHTVASVEPGDTQSAAAPSTIDPELLKEEADRAALTPEVAPDLSLPRQGSVLALDTFQGTPELVPMPQSSGDLNRVTAHNTLRGIFNAHAAPHAMVTLRGERSPVQLHVESPTFFLRLGDDSSAPTGGGAPITVDTHGATGDAPTAPTGGSAGSRYAIVRVDVRTAARVLDSFSLDPARPAENVVWAASQTLPGGHWLKLTAAAPLTFGEYALVEVLSERDVNLGVWDFGIHPVAPDNRDAYKPEPKRRIGLEPRRPEQ